MRPDHGQDGYACKARAMAGAAMAKRVWIGAAPI